MVRWSQVSLAAGYLVELRPVVHGVPGGSGLMRELEDATSRCQLIRSQLKDFIELIHILWFHVILMHKCQITTQIKNPRIFH